jgi:flavin-dependent dehydrogenase
MDAVPYTWAPYGPPGGITLLYDVIIVGARCAGAPTAMLLARNGYRVLLLDQATFPSDVMQNHVVLYRGARYLHRWGLMERVLATNCPPIRRFLTNYGDFPLVGYPPADDGVPGDLAPRRIILDKLLIDAAVEAGADFREGCPVEAVLQENGRVTGVRYQTPGGASEEARSRVVVGADGRHSFVARSVAAPAYNEHPPLTCAYYSYWSGTGTEGIEIHILDRPVLLLAFQTNDGLSCIAAQWPVGEFHAIRADIEGNLFKTLDLAPELAARVRAGTREERFRGTADVANFFRQASGPGWALVGDAGVNKDPFTASGISDAFRDADLLAAAIDEGLSGRSPLDEALAQYGRQRDEAILPHYEDAIQSAAFPSPNPGMLQQRAAVRGNQAATDRMYGIGRGTVTPEEFAAMAEGTA